MSRIHYRRGTPAATQTWRLSPWLPAFLARIPLRSKAWRLLLGFCIMLVLIPAVTAQTSSQQYVYSSQPLNSTTSVVAGFSKTSQTGALGTVAGSPFNERLEGGLVAIDGQGKFLFVLNPSSDDISMFQINQTSGALTEVQASPFKVPRTINPNLAPSQPLSIATEKSGKFLFVGYYLGDFQGNSSVVSLAIDTSGSSPVLLTTQSTELVNGGAPSRLLVDPKGIHLYVGMTLGQNGLYENNAEVYSIDALTGALSFAGTHDGQALIYDRLGS
jgi:6-phosphogluconolactonase (cycloisomerase 2 family)